MKELIKTIITRFHTSELPQIVSRNLQLPINSQKVISVIGARRCGKTYMLFETISKLISSGIPKHNILYLNFEDERLQLNINELDLIMQAWRELHPNEGLIEHYFFFDEIQNIEGWEKFIRRIYDTETQNIFVTGSNSAFLGTDIATSLRGRTLPYEVFPFTFDEYLRFRNLNSDYYSEPNKALIINAFKDYLNQGGFPETVNRQLLEQSNILRTFYYVMLYKDLIERYSISNVPVIKYFIEKLADNITKYFSINKIYNSLKSQGLKLDKNQLYQFIDYVENIYLIFSIMRYDYSYSARSKSDKKAYFIDNGLLNTLSHNFTENRGKLLENAIFIFLRQKFGSLYEKTIFYFKEKHECDFVVFDRDKPTHCIQVSYDISEAETRKRELSGLVEAMNFFKLEKGYIITAEQEEEIIIDSKQILVRPAFKVFIDNKL
ncbi:MAG TPA: ATPase [Bacteroidales bacterium]|nr:ATPase [Bacteroidales bacterium]